MVWPVVTGWRPAPALRDSAGLRVMTMNVLSMNRQFDRAYETVRAMEPDILVIQEVNRVWAQEIARWDYFSTITCYEKENNFGIALLARVPLVYHFAGPLRATDFGFPIVEATVATDTGPIHIVGVHPMAPLTARMTDLTKDFYRHFKRRFQRPPDVLLGDLNATIADPYYHMLLNDYDFRAASNPLVPTWGPRGIPILAIDHVLIGPDLAAGPSAVSPYFGSDHRAVAVAVAVGRMP